MTFDVWSVLFCLILSICTYATQSFYSRQSTPLAAMFTTNVIVSVSEALAFYFFRGDASEIAHVMVRITNFLVFLGNHIMLYLVLLFIIATIEKNGGKVGRVQKDVVRWMTIVSVALLFLSRVFRFYYDFDAQNRYYRLPSFWLMFGLQAAILVAIGLIILTHWRSLARLERISLTLFLLLPVIAVILQVFIFGISLTTIVNTTSLTMVFLTYELEYSKRVIERERLLLDEIIGALVQAKDAKDRYTKGHSGRVAAYARMLAGRMGMGEEGQERIHRMALLHDVGKIGVPDEVLNKAGRLTDEEFELIKAHAAQGKDILEAVGSMPDLKVGAHWHHEHYDGKGYPDGLSGEDIPLEARIICVADSYDAMTSDRVYRGHLPQEVVRRELLSNMGTQFDPEIARHMVDIIDGDTDYHLHG